MSLMGFKHRTEKRIVSQNFLQHPEELPKSMLRKFQVSTDEFDGRQLWTFKPGEHASGKVILYIHGGAFITGLTKYDWGFIEKLVDESQATVIVPDYPLAPEANFENVYQYLDALNDTLLSDYPNEKITFLGNSAGGGLVLGFAQKLRNENRPQPSRIILVSPWLD